jgi:hypothetical protein
VPLQKQEQKVHCGSNQEIAETHSEPSQDRKQKDEALSVLQEPGGHAKTSF